MPVVAALLDSRAALPGLRRTLLPGPPSLLACRSAAGLGVVLRTRQTDAVVLGLRRLREAALGTLCVGYPAIPVIVYGAFRPDDGALALELLERGQVADLAVLGVDDAVVGELVRRRGLGRARREALADAPRLLRLTDQLQLETWSLLLPQAGRPIRATDLASEMGTSREHLSRQFAAGGAPNLKRVVDMLRLVSAAQLLANPACDLRTVAGILGFATPSHLHAMSRRITGESAGALARLGPRGVLLAFRRVGMRSRV